MNINANLTKEQVTLLAELSYDAEEAEQDEDYAGRGMNLQQLQELRKVLFGEEEAP